MSRARRLALTLVLAATIVAAPQLSLTSAGTASADPLDDVEVSECVHLPPDSGYRLACVDVDGDGGGDAPTASVCVFNEWRQWLWPGSGGGWVACADTTWDEGFLPGPGVCVRVPTLDPLLCLNGNDCLVWNLVVTVRCEE